MKNWILVLAILMALLLTAFNAASGETPTSNTTDLPSINFDCANQKVTVQYKVADDGTLIGFEPAITIKHVKKIRLFQYCNYEQISIVTFHNKGNVLKLPEIKGCALLGLEVLDEKNNSYQLVPLQWEANGNIQGRSVNAFRYCSDCK